MNAIAGSAYYQCYLNSAGVPVVERKRSSCRPSSGAGTGQYAGDHPTATTAFAANYLETEIGHQLVLQLAGERHVTVTQADLTTARANLTQQISEVMSEILQTQQGQDVRYGCSLTGQPLTGKQVLDTLPASFVDEQVQFVATATALQEDLAGVGSSAGGPGELLRRRTAPSSTRRVSRRRSSPARARRRMPPPRSPSARRSPRWRRTPPAAEAVRRAAHVLADLETKLPVDGGPRAAWPPEPSRRPINDNGTYLLLQITSRTPTPYAKAKAAVANAVQAAGSTATQTALTAVERRSSVSVNPQYGVWVPGATPRCSRRSRPSRPTC